MLLGMTALAQGKYAQMMTLTPANLLCKLDLIWLHSWECALLLGNKLGGQAHGQENYTYLPHSDTCALHVTNNFNRK